MSDQSTLGLGRLVPEEFPLIRDAIHIAVIPVRVAGKLAPGTKVRFAKDNHSYVEAANGRPYMGVIDPYLQEPVEPFQRCWLYLNPGSIRSLRHTWSHPAFDKEQL